MKTSKRIMLLLTSIIFSLVLLSVVAFAADVDELCGNAGCDDAKCVWMEEGREGCKLKFILRCPVCYAGYGVKYEESHDFKEYSRIDATCMTEGKVFYSCETAGCFVTKSEVLPVDPEAHSYCEWINLTAPTCNLEGAKYRVCTNYVEADNGKKVYCDNRQDAAIPVDDNAHIFEGEWIRTVAPTCEAPGEEKTVCTVCNSKEITREIPAHSDTLSDELFEIIDKPSCIKEGSMKGVCVKCNANVTVVLPKTQDHSWVIKNTVPASCDNDGLNTYNCQWHLDKEKTEVIPATGHSFKEYKSNNNASCEKDGTKTAKCENCDALDTITDENTRKQHISGGWLVTDGNCNDGIKAYKFCLYCKAPMTAETAFPSGTHLNRRIITVEATCTTEGYTADMCTDCGTVWSKQTFPLAHSYPDEWTVISAATCTETGLRVKECTKCHSVKEEVIKKLDHKYLVIKEGVEATCTEKGYTDELYCMICLTSVPAQELPALGHNKNGSNGACNRCYKYYIEKENGETVLCKCIGHNPDGLAKFVFKFMVFIYKLFGMNQYCECGAVHYE